MNDKQVLKYLLELGVERLLERNPEFSFTGPTISPPMVEQVPVDAPPQATSFDEERFAQMEAKEEKRNRK